MNLEIGDILLTRNDGDDRTENQTPGYYNHAAIYIGENKILEAQAHIRDGKWSSNKNDHGGVILADTDEFFKRYPTIKILRNSELNKSNINEESRKMIGLGYKRLASIFIIPRKTKRGVNCVSLIRKIIVNISGSDPKWKIPDDIANDNDWTEVNL